MWSLLHCPPKICKRAEEDPMPIKKRFKRSIRRFTDDVLPKELCNSIRKTAKKTNKEITRRVFASGRRFGKWYPPTASDVV
jgi:hypothetical protein